MKLLSVETATEACSAALMIDDEIISRYQLAPRKHTELILPMCDVLIKEAGIRISDLDAVAFGRGPGSFTGVRIATGVAQGIALAHDLPVIPISTLAAMAQEVMLTRQQTHVLVAIDARMNEVYWAAYTSNSEGYACLVDEEIVVPPDHVPVPEAKHWYATGTGWQPYSEILKARMGDYIVEYDEKMLPKAEFIVRLAKKELLIGNAVTAENALPVYLRDKIAEKRV